MKRSNQQVAEGSRAHAMLAGLYPARLADRIGAPGDREIRFAGAALVVDVAGYTPLTEALTAAGEDGPERVSALIDRLFARFISLIQESDGEVVHFAGDALVAYFTADQLVDAARAAVECAGRILRVDKRSLAGENLPVAVHAGLATGPLWAARIERFADEQDLLFGGSALRAAYRATRQAAAGKLAMDASTRDLLATRDQARALVAVATVGEDTPTPASGEASGAPEALVAPSVRDRIASGGTYWLAELRSIASLFVRVGGLDENSPGALERFRVALMTIDRVLANHGPTSAPGRLAIDDNGLTFIWVAGGPLGASAVDAERNLAMAHRLCSELGTAGFPCSAGFATGRAFCGVIGTQERREMVTIGRPMNLAARLMDLGRGLLIADPPQGRPLRDIQIVARDPVRLKGFDSPVAIAEVVARAPVEVHVDRITVIGRAPQTQQIDAVLQAAPAGLGAICLIGADAGMGKSTLLRACLERARARGSKILQGGAQSAARTSAYFAWRPIFRQLFDGRATTGSGDLEPDERTKAQARARAWLVDAGIDPELAPLLSVVLPLGLPDNQATQVLQGRARADATIDLLIRLLRAADTDQVITLEDVHFMDSVSLSFVDKAAHAIPNLVLLATGRPGEAIEHLATRLADLNLTRIQLAPMSEQSIGALLADRLGSDDIAPRVLEQIARVTDGNPLFAQEYLYLLRETGKLHAGGAEVGQGRRWDWAHEGAKALPVPDTVLSVVASRIDALAPEDQLIIKAASVFGDGFESPDLERINPAARRGPDLQASLQRLVRDRLIEPGDAADHFRFAHGQIQLAAYNLLLIEQRIALHAEVGRTLAANLAGDLDRHLPLLVHHFSAAHEWKPAVEYADRAADLALRQGAYGEAMSFLETCLDHADAAASGMQTQRLIWLRKMGDAAAGAGDLRKRREAAELALQSAGHRHRPPAGVAALVTGFRLLVRVPRRLDARDVRSRATRTSNGTETENELAACHRHLAVVSYFSNQPIAVGYHATMAIKHAERCGPGAELAGALAELGTCLGLAGFDAAGCRHLGAATRVAEQISDDAAIAYSSMVACLYFVGVGRWDEVEVNANKCQFLCERRQDHVNWANAQMVRFWMNYYRGETSAAEVAARQLDERARRTRNRQQQAWSARSLGLCAIDAQQWSLAEEQLGRAHDLARDGQDMNELIPLWGALASLRQALGRGDEAIAYCRRALAALTEQKRLMAHSTLEGISALVAVALQSAADANPGHMTDREVRAALAILQNYANTFPIGKPRLDYWRGSVAARANRIDRARVLWTEALTRARLAGLGRDVALLETALARFN